MHRLGRLQREAALEHRQLRERGLLGLRQQLPRPVERRAQRGLPLGAPPVVASSLNRSLMRASSVAAHHPDAGGRQLDRQRQPVEQLDQRLDRGRVGAVGSKSRLADCARCTNSAEASRGASGASGSTARRRARAPRARDEEARVAGAAEPVAERRLGVTRDLLEVVEHDQAAAATGDGVPELHRRIVLAERHVEGLGHRRRDAVDAARLDRSQNHTPPGKSPSQVQAKRVASRVLPVPPMPSQADQPRAVVESARELLEGSRRPMNTSRSAGSACAISRTGSQRSPSRTTRYAFASSAGGANGAAGVVDLEQLDRLGRPFSRQCPCEWNRRPRSRAAFAVGDSSVWPPRATDMMRDARRLRDPFDLDRLRAAGDVGGAGLAQHDPADVQAGARPQRNRRVAECAVVGGGVAGRVGRGSNSSSRPSVLSISRPRQSAAGRARAGRGRSRGAPPRRRRAVRSAGCCRRCR